MRALWRSLHDDLMQSIEIITFKKDFDLMRQSSPLLQRFADHYALLDYLHVPGGDLDDKDRILAALVAEAQTDLRHRNLRTICFSSAYSARKRP